MARTVLPHHTNRTLDLLAGLIARREVRVVLSSRIAEAAVIAAGPATIFLDPERAQLYDLILCAGLLRRRREVRARLQDTEPTAGALDPAEAADWMRTVRADLEAKYPRLRQLREADGTRGTVDVTPRIVWDHVDFMPLDEGDAAPGSLQCVPGVHLEGADGDLGRFVDGIAAGTIPLETTPHVPGLPVASSRLDLLVPHVAPARFEQFETRLRDGREAAREAARCIRRKSEGLEDPRAVPRYKSYGTRMDAGRLHDAVVASRLGRPVPMFRRKRRELDYVFRPDEQAALITFDLNALRPGSLQRPGGSLRAVLFLMQTYIDLGMDLVVEAYWDRVVRLPDGRHVYLHLRIPIKGLDDDPCGAMWQRFLTATDLADSEFGEPATAHALHVRQTAELASDLAERTGCTRLQLLYAAVAMPRGRFDDGALLERTASQIDADLRRLRDRIEPASLDVLGIVPARLSQAGAKDGFVREMISA